MKIPTILIADNEPGYFETAKEYLESKGYKVVTASDPSQARTIIERGEIDIAVLDNRMKNHADINDNSGLELAIETAPQIPKIIVTNFPTPELVRAALRQIGGHLPAAVDFLGKGEGLPALLEVIEKILPLRNVFVVHGHDDATRLELESFLIKLHLNPIILMDQSNDGQVLLEKLEHASNSTYAIIALTPDDQCVLKNEGQKLELRARQNVILEMGYFMGKLGRDRVCMLYTEGVVLPSDIHGFTWILKDHAGAWKIKVARDLRAAGIYVDLNDIL